MTIAKFDEVKDAARFYARATEVGCRNRERKTNELLTNWVIKNCRKKKISVYAVYTRTENFGTKKYSDMYKEVCVDNITDWKETEKCYINQYGRRIRKSEIIGWLSK